MNLTSDEWRVDMKRKNLRTALSAAALIGATIMGTNALADPPQGGYGYGMGPGMMGGYGMGPGMMGGYGMGPGMMGGYGMGSGMMGGYGTGSELNLSSEQRGKIGRIQDDVRRKHWALMGKMQDEQAQMYEQYNSDSRDDAAVSKSYRNMSELRHQMLELSLSAQKQIEGVLTKEQREKQKRG
jgi:Spy/CpxP family protein refolding chaperone